MFGADHNINIACHPAINKYMKIYIVSYNSTGAYGTGPRCIYGKRIAYMFLKYAKESQNYYARNNASFFSFMSFTETHDVWYCFFRYTG